MLRIRTRAARVALSAAAGVAAIGLAGSAVVVAAPPGGVTDTPGTPAGSLEITTPNGPVDGRVGFCARNIRVDTSGGPVAQQFMLKFDDHGSYGIGPYTPDANGTLCGTVSTRPADYAGEQGGAADKLPADLCDASQPHTLRLLSSVWGAPGTTPEASQRSISAAISVAGGSCGAAASGGGPAGPDGMSPGATNPGAAAPGGGSPPASAAAVRVRSATLAIRGTAVFARLGGGTAFAKGTATLRSRLKVRLGRSKPAIRTLAKGSFQIAAGDVVELRLPLTPQARLLMRTRPTLSGTLTLAASGAPAVTQNVTVRRAAKAAKKTSSKTSK